MTRPRLVTIAREQLQLGDRLWGEPYLLRFSGPLIVDKIYRQPRTWRVLGRDDDGHEGRMFIVAPDVLIEPRA